MANKGKRQGPGHGQRGQRSDQPSYITETSSITNPPELLSTCEDFDDNVSYISVTSALTGWTTENSAAPSAEIRQKHTKLGSISEASASDFDSHNFPLVWSSKSEGSDSYSSAEGEDISIYNDGESVEASLHASDFLPTKAINKAVQIFSPRTKVASPRNNPPERHNERQLDESSISSKASRTSIVSNASKKRAPVPPLKDPAMEDTEDDQMWEVECNCEINPTPIYQVIISKDWNHTINLLDGKESESMWSIPGLNAIIGVNEPDVTKMREYQTKLRAQARTWILHREARSGVLVWRMLPIHVALTYQAPFDVVLRLYHLYPGSVRCRDHRGMLPLHICFFRGVEDRVLELFLDVFPDALDVKDDKGRLPIDCTPEDGSDNERRSNIIQLFLKHMLGMSETLQYQQEDVNVVPNPVALAEEATPAALAQEATSIALTQKAILGATPRYASNDADDDKTETEEKINSLIFNAFKIKKPKAPKNSRALKVQTKIELKEDNNIPDRYAMEDEENRLPCNRRGLSPILEEGTELNLEELKREMLVQEKRKGIRKIFGNKKSSIL